MAEITLDGDLAVYADVDGEEATEISIDGCVITFEKLYRSGYFAITGGSGSKQIHLPDSNYIMEAGIRFRGRTAVQSTLWTDYGSSCDTGWTGNTQVCCAPTRPSVPSNPYACEHSSATGWTVRIGCTRAAGTPAFTGTAESGTGDLASFTFPEYPSTQLAPGFGLVTTNSANVFGCVISNSGTPGNDVRGAVAARTRYTRTCYSADTTMALPGGSVQYPFILSSGSKSPSSSGSGVVTPDDETGDLFWAIPLPWELFTAGGTTTLQFTEVLGSGNVDIEVFVVYR